MTRTLEALGLAITRLRSMRRDRERVAPSSDGSHVALLIASCEAVALDAGIAALEAQLAATHEVRTLLAEETPGRALPGEVER